MFLSSNNKKSPIISKTTSIAMTMIPLVIKKVSRRRRRRNAKGGRMESATKNGHISLNVVRSGMPQRKQPNKPLKKNSVNERLSFQK